MGNSNSHEQLKHNENEWKILSTISSTTYKTIYKAKKLNGKINDIKVKICNIKVIETNRFDMDRFNLIRYKRKKNKDKELRSYVTKYYGYGLDDNKIYIYSKYIKNSISIKNLLNLLPNNSFNEELALAFGFRIAKSLEHLHRFNITHGNINCENVMLLYNNEGIITGVNLVDFDENNETIISASSTFTGYKSILDNIYYEPKNIENIMSDLKGFSRILIEMVGENITTNHWTNGSIGNNIKVDSIHSFRNKFYYMQPYIISINKESITDIDRIFMVLYNKPFTIGSMPYSARYLTLSSFNQPIEIGSIPYSVTNLTLSSFNQPIEIGSIPYSVTNLTLSSFNQPITIISIPYSVTNLTLSSYNQPITIGSIPYSVRYLTLSSYNQPIEIGSIPCSVTNLTLPSFNQSISNIPKSVNSLLLGSNFSHFESLSNFWISRLELINIDIDKITNIVNHVSPSIESLVINNYNVDMQSISRNSIELRYLNDLGIIKPISQETNIAYKLDGSDSKYIFQRIIKYHNEFCVLYRLKDYSFSMEYYGTRKDKNGLIYMYTEYIKEAISITDQLKSLAINEKMNEDDIISLLIEITKAIKIIHSNQIIHGNINCDNILLIPNENGIKSIKIIGFNQSLLFNNSKTPTFFELIGKETHMAPEVKLQNRNASYKSDIWSLGCTLIEMVGGDLKQIDNNGAPIIPNHLSNYLRNIIQRCLVINQDGRFNVEQLLIHLNNEHKEYKYCSFYQPITYESIRSIPYELIVNLELTDFNIELIPRLSPSSITSLSSKPEQLKLGLEFGLIPPSVKLLSLPSFNQIVYIGSIPSTVTHLSFKILNKEIQNYSIPSSVTYLDLGDEFDIQNYGDLTINSILTLRCGFKFTSMLNQRTLPRSVTDLQLDNYNLSLNSNSIPSTVTYLTLGSDFTDFESLSNLPSSIIDLKFGTSSSTELILGIPEFIKDTSITSLFVNGKNIQTIIFINTNFKSNSELPLDLLIHKNWEWGNKSNLGKGGFGFVFKAKKLNGILNDMSIQECAIKFIEKTQFRRNEIDILQLLNDNHYSIKYYGCGIDELGNIYIYMEYNDQLISITDKLKQIQTNQRFEEHEVKSLGIDIVTALHSIHQNHNIIHRDIKCANILLNYNSDNKRIGVKFIDYGLSMMIDKDSYYSFAGTETHLAPEVKLQNAKINFKSDIFSVGCTLIEMAGGNLKIRSEKDGSPIVPDHLSPKLRKIIKMCIVSNFNARLDSKQLVNLLSKGKIILKNSDEELLINKRSTMSTFDEPLMVDSIVDKSITSLSLPLFNDYSIQIGSIPSTVTHLSFKIFNKEIQDPQSIPSSVTYLDLGDKFDIQNNGNNIPNDSILTLRCGFKFTKVLNQRSIPSSVTDLQLYNYNLKLNTNSIPSTVTYLTLGSDYKHSESISNLPSSIITLKFHNSEVDHMKINN